MDGGWGQIQNDTQCSKTCGPGVQEISKYCTSPTPRHGGANCSCDTFDTCDGKKATTKIPCTMRPCPGISHSHFILHDHCNN